jgi:hypothetical protein
MNGWHRLSTVIASSILLPSFRREPGVSACP